MRENQRVWRHIYTASMIEDLADTIRESASGTDDTTRARMLHVSGVFSQRALELRAMAAAAAASKGVALEIALELDL